MDFRTQGLADLAEQVRTKAVSSRELVAASLDRIERLNPTINAFVAVDGEAALDAAAAIDERLARGEDVGALAGIPIGVKDLEDAAGLPTTSGSAIYASRGPATEDSAHVARLRAAGCVIVGKTNTPELGWTAQTTNALFGATTNPWNPAHTPGGSSGGTAAALASGMVPLATGSDGGGSIRIPAALCGLPGFKTSLGRVPHGGGASPHWGHLSTRGPMAVRVADIALALDAVIGPDPTDLRSLPMPESSWVGAVAEAGLPRRVAWSPTLGYGTVDGEVRAACERAVAQLADAGTDVVEVEEVFGEDPGLAWFTLTCVYNLRALGRYEGTDVWEKIDPGLRASAEHGKTITADQFVRADDQCHMLNLRLVELFHKTPLLLCPTVATVAPELGGVGTVDGNPEPNWVRYTYPFNLTRSPAGTIPVGLNTAGLPIGIQVIGTQHADMAVLRTMSALEDVLDLELRAPV